MVIIEIFGTGCDNCARLEARVRNAVERLGIKAEIVKVEDFETFIRRGISATPGMAIDGEIVTLGRVPTIKEIIEILTDRKSNTLKFDDTGHSNKDSKNSCGN